MSSSAEERPAKPADVEAPSLFSHPSHLAAVAVLLLLALSSSLPYTSLLRGVPASTLLRCTPTPLPGAQRGARAQDRTGPRVAWLIAGNARTLGLPFVHGSIRSYGIDAFGGNVTVFFWRLVEEEADAGGMNHGFADAGNVSAAIRALGVDVLEEVHAAGSGTVIANPSCAWMEKHPSRARSIGQLQNLARAFALVEKEEQRIGARCDFVIRARPDVAFLQPLPRWHEWPAAHPLEARGWYPGLDLNVPRDAARGPDPPAPRMPPPNGDCFDTMPHDMFALLTRAAAEDYFLAPLNDFTGCRGAFALSPRALCCGGGYTGALAYTMVHSQHVRSWAPWRFPIFLVRRVFADATPDFCNVPYTQVNESNPWGADWMQRCATRPVPGCADASPSASRC